MLKRAFQKEKHHYYHRHSQKAAPKDLVYVKSREYVWKLSYLPSLGNKDLGKLISLNALS